MIKWDELVEIFLEGWEIARILVIWYFVQVDVLKKEDTKVMTLFFHKGDRFASDVGKKQIMYYYNFLLK